MNSSLKYGIVSHSAPRFIYSHRPTPTHTDIRFADIGFRLEAGKKED
jgi:hypothetical protein